MKKVFSIVAVVAILGTLAAASLGSAADLKVRGGTIQAGADYDLKMYNIAEVWEWGLNCETGLVEYVKMGFGGVDLPVGGDNALTFCVAITDDVGGVIQKDSITLTWPYQPESDYRIPGSYYTDPITIPLCPPVPACDITDIEVYVYGTANSGEMDAQCPELN